MQIASANIQFASEHFHLTHRQQTLSVDLRDDRPAAPAAAASSAPTGQVNVTPPPATPAPAAPAKTAQMPVADNEAPASPRLQLLKTIVEQLTGREIQLSAGFQPGSPDSAPAADPPPSPAGEPAPPPFGLRLSLQQQWQEQERTSFSARGTVHTRDGRQLNFTLDLAMQREHVHETNLTLTAGALRDPLVINYAGQAAELTQDKFAFDLTGDGSNESISTLTRGSAFLAHDRDHNGRIDNGGELFGAATGNGFAELARHDQDGNGFIDAGDPIYTELRLFEPDSQGRQTLTRLQDRDIGAIFLGHADTPFALTDSDNQQHGRIARTGIYLQQTGKVGTVQHVDLAV